MTKRKRDTGIRVTSTVELTEDAIAQACIVARRSRLLSLIVPPMLEDRANWILEATDTPFFGADVKVREDLPADSWVALL